MYDKYPVYDVPRNNIVQRFFGQRWSAIVIEIALTIVLAVAAGRALDLFGPLPERTAFAGQGDAAVEAERRPLISLDSVKERGLAYVNAGQFEAAAATFDLAIAVDAEDASNYSWRGYIDMRAGAYEAAIDRYQKLLELEPNDFDGHNSLCWAYGETGEFTSALAHCDAALKTADSLPEYTVALENRCWLQVEMGELAAATRDCLQVLEISRPCAHEVCALAHYNLGRILAAQGQTRRALQQFNLAYEIGSTYSDMYLDIAEFYDTLGYRSAAQASYQRYWSLGGGA